MFYSHLGILILENCNRHRHRFYCARFRTRLGQELLTSHVKCCTFAVAMRKQRRLRAAAQHSSSELGSAFTLHRNCIVNGRKSVTD